MPSEKFSLARAREFGVTAVRLDTSLELLVGGVPQGAERRVLATVVSTAGSTYRKPGARMLIMADGTCVGLLSGGCLEADLAIHAREVMAGGVPRAVEYDMRGPDDILFGIGAGCEGAMRVLLEPSTAGTLTAAALQAAGDLTAAGNPAVLVVVHDSAELPLGTRGPMAALPAALQSAAELAVMEGVSRYVDQEMNGRRLRAFVQYLAPAPHLLVCGAGPDAQPVVGAAVLLGWRVTVVDHRQGYALAARFPRADVRLGDPRELRHTVPLDRCHAAVVMSHHLPSDVAYLGEMARAGLPLYVGLLGPAARRQRIAEELGPLGETLRTRLRGPVGIDIGAVTPEGIALSIVSQIHAWLAGRADA